MPEVLSRDARIRYDDEGRGEPALLFLPGWCTRRAGLRADRFPDEGSPPGDLDGPARARRVRAGERRLHQRYPRGGCAGARQATGARRIVPVALSQAGWFAVELRRRLGAQSGWPVLLDWIVLFSFPRRVSGVAEGISPRRGRGVATAVPYCWLEGVRLGGGHPLRPPGHGLVRPGVCGIARLGKSPTPMRKRARGRRIPFARSPRSRPP